MRSTTADRSRVSIIAPGSRRSWRSAPAISALLMVLIAAARASASEPPATKYIDAAKASQDADTAAQPSEPAMPVPVGAIAVSADGKWIAAATGFNDEPGELVLWDVASREPKWAQRHDYGVRSTAISPDGKLVAAGHYDGRARLTAAETGEVIATLGGHAEGINSIAFSPDGKSLVTGSLDRTIKIWNVA